MSEQRADRVADVVRQALADVLQREARDPRIGFVTVTGVKLSPDLRHAQVFVSAMGDDDSRAETVQALNHAAPFYQKAIAGRTRLRFTPRLRFHIDTAITRGQRVEELLREISEDHDRQETAENGEDS